MKNIQKYTRQYFMPPVCEFDWVKKDYIDKAPIWCSVDLRDGNQALVEPMSLDEKLEFFQMLIGIGFKEIEVGFPAASETEFAFIRALIEKDMIPDDVTIQVLTQAREHIIRKTFEAVKGTPHAIIHLYNSTSLAQREQVFRKNREEIIHPHNDRGCGVGDAELGLLAGADRIEGTLFGNGERTGNVDVVTIAMNMYPYGVDPKLNFEGMPEIREKYERLTQMHVGERQPYAGDLVFTAFSGSHQDAISKGMAWRTEKDMDIWTVPYLPIDPADVGRTYDSDVIRINSQSGKGGVSYILKQNFSISLPKQMQEEVGYVVKQVSDESHSELSPEQVFDIFKKQYVDDMPAFVITECHFKQGANFTAEVTLLRGGQYQTVRADGNGRLDAVSNAIKQYFGIDYRVAVYEEHALSQGSSSKAAAYVGIRAKEKMYWGVGIDDDIISASDHALTVAVNKLEELV